MLRLLTSTTVALLLTAVAFAQSTVTGKWEGQTPNGFKIVLDLKATESTVTGTLTREDTTVPIAEGKATKNTAARSRPRSSDQTESFTGEVAGDQLTVWLDRQGRERAATLTRVKSK